MFKEALTISEILLWYDAMGIQQIMFEPRPEDSMKKPVAKSHPTQFMTAHEAQAWRDIYPEYTARSREIVDSISDLPSLEAAVRRFDGCTLKNFARNTVFADGTPQADIMLIGEAPGINEDEQGIPFCGESGKLLDNILKSIGLDRRKNVYITNTVFWRPPANRNPTIEEVENCRPFVEKHIALIKPKLIVLVGSVAANALLPNTGSISKIRQTYYQYNNHYLESPIPVTAIFHPAYLLRQPLQKAATWSDMLRIKHFLASENS